jgi:hypothetical protein
MVSLVPSSRCSSSIGTSIDTGIAVHPISTAVAWYGHLHGFAIAVRAAVNIRWT